MSDEFYMQLALKEAWKSQILTYPNPAVGCVVLDRFGKILSISSHKKAGFAHAEVNAVFLALCCMDAKFKKAFLNDYNTKFNTKFSSINECENLLFQPNFLYEFIFNNHNKALAGATAYVTLEPCAHRGKTESCAKLLSELGFARIVIGMADYNQVAKGGAEILQIGGTEIKFGICKNECELLLEPFSKWQSGNFSFFKVALSANGVATGRVISNLSSRTLSHRLRDVSELLLIGGNSVRIDHPTLDTRLIQNGRNPDILIYSNMQEFDPTIPLFNVANRQVKISSNLDEAFKKKLTMIEGGEGLLNTIYEQVDWFLLFHSSKLSLQENLKADLRLKPLFVSSLDDDSYGWYKLCENI